MTTSDDVGAPMWRKSSYSGANGGECLEVADGQAGTVPVRDSKDAARPALVFRAGQWGSFVTAVKNGRLDEG